MGRWYEHGTAEGNAPTDGRAQVSGTFMTTRWRTQRAQIPPQQTHLRTSAHLLHNPLLLDVIAIVALNAIQFFCWVDT